jgi:type I restriction enzyme M protein
VVGQEEIRRNEYNLNIPRYVDSSEATETWDIYASMFGGIPKSEIAAFDDYWQTFDGLKSVLFTDNGSPYSALAVDDIEKAIRKNPEVIAWRSRYTEAFADFAVLLKDELIVGWETLNISKEESVLADAIFERLEQAALVDKYSAYQALDDGWTKTAVDLEILQTEGFDAARKVDPNIVLKKKDGKDQEVQEGWVGHVIPFELAQSSILKEETAALRQKEERLSDIGAACAEIIDSLSEEDKENDVFNEAKDAFAAAAVGKKIKELFGSLAKAKTAALAYDEDSFERKIAQVQELIDEEKTLKTEVRKDAAALHLLTKETIESLTDEQVVGLLEAKWIAPLTTALEKIPDNIVAGLVSRVRALADKYATTYAEVAGQIAETKSTLSALIDRLTGNEYDMKGLREFQSLLRGGNNA